MTDKRLLKLLPIDRWPSVDEAARSRWFSPLASGRLRLADRTWIPAMVPWRSNEAGEVTPGVLAWYERFARGRPGAIVVEATGVRDVPSGPLLRIGHDRFVPGLRELVRVVREASGGHTKLLIQIIDFLSIKRRPARATFLARFVTVDAALRERLGLSPESSEVEVRARLATLDTERLRTALTPRDFESMEMGHRERVTDLHLAHVRRLPETLPSLFADAARRARDAGFDGVELHYAHAYTMSSFLSRLNTRDDGYGGDLAGRLRLPLEVYAEVRRAVGDDYVVGCRFLGDDVVRGGSRIDDARQIGVAFARAGMDFLSVSKGGRFEDAKQPKEGQAAYPYTGRSGDECMPTVHLAGEEHDGALGETTGPFGRNVPLAREIRTSTRAAGIEVPIVAAGGISSFWQAEAILARADADIVGAARQSLADPDWFEKLRRGEGETIRRCFFTNYCEALDQHHKEVTCQRWDREELDAPDVTLSSDGKRRLVAPLDLRT